MPHRVRNEWESRESQVFAAYEKRAFASAFSATANRYWVVKGKRQINDLRDMLDPRRVHTWRTAKLPRDLQVGDRVIFWEGAPHLHFVGIGEVGAWEREKDAEGNSHFWLMYQSGYLDDGPGITELREEPLFENASFLKAAVAGTLFPLTAEQASSIAGRLGVIDEAVRRAWPDLFDRKPRSSTRSAPIAVAPAPPSNPVSKQQVVSTREPNATKRRRASMLVSGETYRILSVRPPWAWSIIFAGKNIENRSWTTGYRGPILIHASSKKSTGWDLADAREEIAQKSGISLPRIPTEFPRSCILGFVDIVDMVTNHNSPWAYPNEQHWVLGNPRPLAAPLEGIDGKLNLWNWTCP